MSSILEKTLGGLMNNFLGATSIQYQSSQGLVNVPGLKNVSLGLIHFVERLQAARRISKQEEEHCIQADSIEWIKVLSNPGVNSAVVSDFLCRAIIANIRGYSVLPFHIHGIKLTQSHHMLQKRIGYLYVSRVLGPGSELTLLLVNTIQRDLSSVNVLEVAASIVALPTILTMDITSSIILALTHCLAHQKAYIRRRSAVMIGVIARSCHQDLQESSVVPHLLHLLADEDPGVAISAIGSLTIIHKVCKPSNTEIRDQIAASAAHLLRQAVNGLLPKDYNVKNLPAPFVQIQMLRIFQSLSTKDWNVPTEVLASVQEVMQQPIGGKEIALYGVFLECIFTITKLPHQDSLVISTFKIVLGFLKSTNMDLKYVGLRALASIFNVLEESLTPSHLEAVLDCLYHSDTNLQAKTLKLLCTMANVHNYQAVCSTLLEFYGRSSCLSVKESIISELASIVSLHCHDQSWCVSFITPIILSKNCTKSHLINSLLIVLEEGFLNDKTSRATKDTSQELLLKLFSVTHMTVDFIGLIASVLNLHYTMDCKQVSKYFTDSFLEIIKAHEDLSLNFDSIFTCLKNIGLNDLSAQSEIILYLQTFAYGDRVHYSMREESREIIRWFNNYKTSLRVISTQDAILKGKLKPDLTLSFLDNYVIQSLEEGYPPYNPLRFAFESNSNKNVIPGVLTCSIQSLQSFGSEEGSSSSSISTQLTSVVDNGSLSCGNLLVKKAIWTPQGRISQVSENMQSRNNSSRSITDYSECIPEFQSSNGSVDLADEAQEEVEDRPKPEVEDTDCSAVNVQRSLLTQALLSSLRIGSEK